MNYKSSFEKIKNEIINNQNETIERWFRVFRRNYNNENIKKLKSWIFTKPQVSQLTGPERVLMLSSAYLPEKIKVLVFENGRKKQTDLTKKTNLPENKKCDTSISRIKPLQNKTQFFFVCVFESTFFHIFGFFSWGRKNVSALISTKRVSPE